ncbi:MAG TPA: peptidoglycan-associated lipoprotein Pal [Desulfobacterales bacterium]|nr:peptidoglycan-associated lipoprotein Pal [Desulfobacterales bacterium]
MSFLLLAGGCSQHKIQSTPPSPAVSAAPTAQHEAPTVTTPPGTEESLNTPAPTPVHSFTILEGRTTGPMLPVYFNFDRSNIRKDQISRIEGNAQYLRQNTQATIVVQGNCDERGTSEYNMALGERRAQSAKRYLINLGINPERITTISFGEEKPLNFGHDELAWSQNRRDDFVQNR